MSITLPPLPEPTMTWTLRRDSAGTGYYTADQLRARDIAVARAVREACAADCDAQTNVWAQYCAASIRAIQIEELK